MTGNNEILTNLQPSNMEFATFADGVKGTIPGSGMLNVLDLTKLKIVFLVEGLKANLISFSQLCDQDLYVNFVRPEKIPIF